MVNTPRHPVDDREKELRAVGVVNDELFILEKILSSPTWSILVFRVDTDSFYSRETALSIEEAESRFWYLAEKYGLQVESSSDDLPRERGHYSICEVEDCEECSHLLVQTGDTVHAKGFADSYKCICSNCGHKQHIASW